MSFLTISGRFSQGYDMKIAAVQMSGFPGDVRGNLDKVRAQVRAGAKASCRLLLFPEISDLGYDMRAIAQEGRDWWPRVRDELCGLAREHEICLVCGVCLPGQQTLFNALVAFGPNGDILTEYRKIHLFAAGDADETEVFSPGTKIVSFDFEGIRLGLSLCYDLRFPELYRAQALSGCQVLLVASAWPKKRIDVWKTLCAARAMENQCFLLGANRVGDQGLFPFGGHSLFVKPVGDMTVAEGISEGLIPGIIDLDDIAAIRRAIPALTHRRPEIYAEALANSAESL
jgi:predicted amidohydrolase